MVPVPRRKQDLTSSIITRAELLSECRRRAGAAGDDGCRSGHPDHGHTHALDAGAAWQHARGARVGEAVAGVARAAAVPCACWLVRESLLGCPVRRSLHTAAGDTARAAPAELDAGPRAAHAREVDAHVVDAQPRAPLHVETKAGMAGQRGPTGGLTEASRSSGQPEA